MKRIGIISDTHATFPDDVRNFLADVDEIWHAGDIGSVELAAEIAVFKPLRAVYGNIDDYSMRYTYPEFQCFECEGRRVLLTHIGMQGGRYVGRVAEKIRNLKPDIFVCGHSHILKIFYDQKSDLLNINPGACGLYGFHRIRSAVRFEIDGTDVRNLEVAEWRR